MRSPVGREAVQNPTRIRPAQRGDWGRPLDAAMGGGGRLVGGWKNRRPVLISKVCGGEARKRPNCHASTALGGWGRQQRPTHPPKARRKPHQQLK